MSSRHSHAAHSYSPLYFLASLGAGGLAVTFFMYLMFWVPHPAQPVPVFEDLARAFQSGSAPLKAAIVLAALGIALFAITNIRLLIWNLGQMRRFAASPDYAQFGRTNAQTQLLAIPLAIAMTINVSFILGLVFVPGLWNLVEFLFPLALIAFALTGVLALRQIGSFLTRVLATSDRFVRDANGSFAQLLPGFALAMIAVGFSAPAAMSHVPLTVATGLIGSTFFATAAVLWTAAFAVIGLSDMLKQGVSRETAPTLLILVPFLTVLGIMMIRQNHGLHTTFDAHQAQIDTLMMLSGLLAAQVVVMLAGLPVLRALDYAGAHLFGAAAKASPGAYALVCPGVALSVMVHFWLNKGLVANDLIAKFSAGYWIVTAVALALQIAMIALVVHLNRQHFGQLSSAKAQPAE